MYGISVSLCGKGEILYMRVRQNWSDQLIGSNWIRRANPERPTVGRGLPTVGHGLPPRTAHRGQVEDFGAKCPDFHFTRVSDYSGDPS